MAATRKQDGQHGKCPVCRKNLAGSPLKGRVTRHANNSGEACAGAGKKVIPSQPAGARSESIKLASELRVKKQKSRGPTKTSQKSNSAAKPPKAGKARPEVLPTQKFSRHSVKAKRDAATDNYWTLFGDVLGQDLETDRNWSRVRLGTSQGTGKRR